MAEYNIKIDKPIEFLRLEERAYNALVRNGVTTVREVVERSDMGLLTFRGIGIKCLRRIRIAAYRFLDS